MKKLYWTLVLSLLSTTLAAKNITVFAAASLTNVLQQIGEEYQKYYPEDTLLFSFASSSTLAKQIEQDAPADIFVSADQQWIDYIQEKQPEKIKNIKVLAENTLVLIAPKTSNLSTAPLEDIDFDTLLGDSYLAVGDDNVPVGRYAKKALEHLKLWEKVKHRLAKGKDVRAVRSYVERGELPLGIVYATEAKMSENTHIIAEFPASSYGEIVYPATIVSDKAEAQRFFDYLSSPTAKMAFEKAGFKPVK